MAFSYKALHIHSSLTNFRKFPEPEVPTVVRKKKERLKGHFHAKVPVRKGKTAIPTSRHPPTGLHRSFRALGPFWHTLVLSRWSGAVAIREELYHHGHGTVDVEQLMQEVLAPQACMKLLEDLVTECRLARSCASRIQVAMLQQMNAQGHWL